MKAIGTVIVVIATAFGVGAFASLIHLSLPLTAVLAGLGGVGCIYVFELL